MKNQRTNLEPAATDKTDVERVENAEKTAKPGAMQKPEVRLGREVQARIGQQLRAMYDDYVNQGVPQDITDLVRRLGEQE